MLNARGFKFDKAKKQADAVRVMRELRSLILWKYAILIVEVQKSFEFSEGDFSVRMRFEMKLFERDKIV